MSSKCSERPSLRNEGRGVIEEDPSTGPCLPHAYTHTQSCYKQKPCESAASLPGHRYLLKIEFECSLSLWPRLWLSFRVLMDESHRFTLSWYPHVAAGWMGTDDQGQSGRQAWQSFLPKCQISNTVIKSQIADIGELTKLATTEQGSG